jgi:hypothetical protein
MLGGQKNLLVIDLNKEQEIKNAKNLPFFRTHFQKSFYPLNKLSVYTSTIWLEFPPLRIASSFESIKIIDR